MLRCNKCNKKFEFSKARLAGQEDIYVVCPKCESSNISVLFANDTEALKGNEEC